MSARRGRTLAIVTCLLFAVAVLVYWPRDDRAVDFGAPMTVAELTGLPDEELLDRLAVECARRMAMAPDTMAQRWEVLPRPLRSLWLVGEMEERLLGVGLLATSVEVESNCLPGMGEVAGAYHDLGLKGPADVIEAATRSLPGLQPAVTACREGRLIPGGNPLAGLDQRFRAACGSAGTRAWRCALVRRNPEAVLRD